MIRCPQCGKSHDVVEFSAEGGSASGGEQMPTITCSCGRKLDLSMLETVEDFLRYFENEDEIEKARKIQEDAMQICRMILDENVAEADIEIAKEELRNEVLELFPDKIQTYQMIYEARFNRLWEQFRK